MCAHLLVTGECAQDRMLARQVVGGEGIRDVRERRDDETMIDPQTGHRLREVAEAVERRAGVEAVWSAGGVDPFVDGHFEVVRLGEVVDESRVDRDLVAQHDLEVLDP